MAAKSKDTASIIPLGDRVLVRPLSREELGRQSASGIIIPETVSEERPERGTVIAVGEGRYDDAGNLVPVRVEVGNTVIFSKYGFDEVELEGVEYIIVKEENILAIIK